MPDRTEELLALTEGLVDEMPQAIRDRWLEISAEVADEIEEALDKPCDLCGVYPGDPHNGEAHLAEMRYEADPQDAIDAYWEEHMYDEPPLSDPEDCEHGDASCRNGRWTCDLCETDMGPMCGVPVERFGLQECQHDESSFIHDKESTYFEHEFEPYVER